jgi:hypothetical protein
MRLLKLAAMALFGYALFEFVRGIMQEAEVAAEGAQASRSGGQRSKGAGGRRGARRNRPAPTETLVMSGPGEGIEVATAEADGGSVPHKVGRGVVS